MTDRHELLGLLVIHALKQVSRRRCITTNAFSFHAGHQIHGHHFLTTRGRGHARHEKREDDKPEVKPFRIDDGLGDLQDDGGMVADHVIRYAIRRQTLSRPHAGV